MYITVVRRDKKHFEYRFALRASINRAFLDPFYNLY